MPDSDLTPGGPTATGRTANGRTANGPAALTSGASSTGRTPLFRHPGRVAIVGGVLFLVAALIVGAVSSSDTSDLQPSQPQPREVQDYAPRQGAIVGPSTAITVDLRDDLVGEFEVCMPTPNECTPVPLDQTRVVRATGQVTFKPTEDTDITEYQTGPVTVRVRYHLQGSEVAEVGQFTWSFTVKA